VKAISPSEARRGDSDEIKADVAARVERINRSLRGYHGRKMSFAAQLIGYGKVGGLVLEQFRCAGWNIEFVADQRDGDFYWFGE
jgi:hypothetical protein